jgi:hypothetical protein
MRQTLRYIVPALFVLWMAPTAGAQQRPLVTEDPETIGADRMLVEAGFDYARDARFTVSGLEGHLLRVPTIGLSVGAGPAAELQIDGALYQRLTIRRRFAAPLASVVQATGDSTYSIDDIVIGAKVRLVPEGIARPSFGMRFATKLPNASNESGLGLDTTDFVSAVMVGKTVQSVRIVGNIGLGIFADPTRGDRQNDMIIYGLSFARAITSGAEVVGEVNGRLDTRNGDPPPGTESRSMARFGARYTVGGWRGDVGLLVGLTSADPSAGITAGFTYVFDSFFKAP